MLQVTKLLVLGLVLTAGSASAASANPKKAAAQDQTKYCMQVEASTGSRIIRTQCRTRADWANVGVDVDEAIRK